MQDDTQQPAATYPPPPSPSLSLFSSLSHLLSLLMLSLSCLQIQFPLILIFVSRSLRSFEYCVNEHGAVGGRWVWPAKWPNLANGYAGWQSIQLDQWPSNNAVFIFISPNNILDSTPFLSLSLYMFKCMCKKRYI